MARPLRTRIQLIDTMKQAAEKPASDPTTQEEQEGLATIAFLAGVAPSNTSISNYIKSLNNTAYAATLKAATHQ